jgi:hypothetical protein
MKAHEHLADQLNRRRLELRLQWTDIARAAGITDKALRAMRRGEYGPSELTQIRLDEALRWQPGSVRAILEGGQPRPLGRLSAEEAADAVTEERMDAILREAGVDHLTLEEALARSEGISEEIRRYLDARGITLSARQARVVETWARRLEEDLRAAEANDEPHAS